MLVLVALAIAYVCYQLTLPQREDFGLTYSVPSQTPGTIRVTAVAAGSPAAAAGIHAGDFIFYGNTALERASVIYATPGSHVTVTVNGTRKVTMVARRATPLQLGWSVTAIRFAFLLIAALLAWRRPDDRATRALVAFLWCYGLGIAIANGVLPTPLLSVIVMQIGILALFLFGTASAALFAATFPSGVAQPLARTLARTAFALAALAVSSMIVVEFTAHSANTLSLVSAGFIAAFALIGLLVVATLITAYVHGAAMERQRRRWVFALLGVALLGPVVDIIVSGLFGYNAIVDQGTLLSLGLLPVGLAYVILRHRVIDVGFVLNRALVYTGVSLIIVAIFVVVETLLAKYVENTSHVTSIAVQLGVALALGFSIRYVHARVDRFVDRVLFRERHLAEAALRTFAQEASYITDLDALLSRCVKTVERYARARGAGIWLSNDTAIYRPRASSFALSPDIDENDPAAVSMRARRVSVHLRDCDSMLPGALGFPMIVRGELLGILVCGQKVDDETYDPDEEAALASLASHVGHGIDAIEVRELRRRLQALSATGGSQPAF